MNILFITPNLNNGGAERVVSVLANGFVLEGHNVGLLMISSDAKDPFYDLNPAIKVTRLYDFSTTGKLSRLQKIKLIKKYVFEHKPDFVIPFLDFVTIYTYFACHEIKETKIIVSERCDPSKAPFVERVLKKHIYKKVSGCVFQTPDAQAYYKNKNTNSVIIPNPVFLNQTQKFDYKSSSRKHEIVLVGSDKKEKNRLMAYKAFSQFVNEYKHNSYVLKIFGKDTEENDKSVLAKLGIMDKVIFAGPTKNWHVEAIDSMAFILTSLYEGMPNALLEAAALQIPCVSTDCPVGGPNLILDSGKKGLLVPVNDDKAMAKLLSDLAVDKNLQNSLSDANKNTKDVYSPVAICKEWIEFLEKTNCK